MTTDFTIECTGDVVTGDLIQFTESVFGGSYKKPKHLGDRVVVAEVISDSYGRAKQQHTFTLLVIHSKGTQPLKAGTKARRKGRNVYRNGTLRRAWSDEAGRTAVANEKHTRGAQARADRHERKTAT